MQDVSEAEQTIKSMAVRVREIEEEFKQANMLLDRLRDSTPT